jgi:hypothetical protein
MNQEDKELLLKDLSARLSYGVKVLDTAEGVNEICELDSIMTSRKYKDKIFASLTLPDDSIMVGIEMVKPYLRPMSSMTEEEKKEYKHLVAFSGSPNGASNFTDWLNAHHFDYRGLIEKGLAIEITENNNQTYK